MGLGTGDRHAVGIHRDCKNAVALSKGVGHQGHHGRHINLQWVDAQVRLADLPGQPLNQGLQTRALGCDAFQGMLAAGRWRYLLRRLRRDQPLLDQRRQ